MRRVVHRPDIGPSSLPLTAAPATVWWSHVRRRAAHAIVTSAVVLEVGIAGWVLGHGALWLLVATLAVTLRRYALGHARRRVLADLAGLRSPLLLAMLLRCGRRPRALGAGRRWPASPGWCGPSGQPAQATGTA